MFMNLKMRNVSRTRPFPFLFSTQIYKSRHADRGAVITDACADFRTLLFIRISFFFSFSISSVYFVKFHSHEYVINSFN